MIADVFRPAGLSLEWYGSPQDVPANTAHTIDVWFHGSCWPMTIRAWSTPLDAARLGWVVALNGHIPETIAVDCAQVMHLAADAKNANTNKALLDVAFLRLMERVVTHELLHVLLMTRGHGSSEFSRPRMQASDWRAMGHLTTSEIRSLRQLYGPEAPVAWTENR
jgi:hypothetical protein